MNRLVDGLPTRLGAEGLGALTFHLSFAFTVDEVPEAVGAGAPSSPRLPMLGVSSSRNESPLPPPPLPPPPLRLPQPVPLGVAALGLGFPPPLPASVVDGSEEMSAASARGRDDGVDVPGAPLPSLETVTLLGESAELMLLVMADVRVVSVAPRGTALICAL